MNRGNDDMPATVDLAFAVAGRRVPRDHRGLLADALDAALPWLAGLPRAGAHRLNVADGGHDEALLSGRTRLTLRLPRDRAADAAAGLADREIVLGGHVLRVGRPQLRELQPHGTLYAHLVAFDDDADEATLLARMRLELDALAAPCRLICGRAQRFESARLAGCSLMLDGLAADAALRVLEHGLGTHRRLGCGLFVPHKSAAAVGAPA